MLGAAAVVGIFAVLTWACIGVVRSERGAACQLIALGITATVTLQAIMNLAVVTGLGPTKGIALPLVSAGGTGWVLTGASLGLLIAMDRRQARTELATTPHDAEVPTPQPKTPEHPTPKRPRRRRNHPAEVVA